MKPLPNTRCPLCGGSNQCQPAMTGSFEGDCWCRTAPVSPEALARVPPEQRGLACLCPRCAQGLTPAAPRTPD
jgi:hypothetical protein